MADVPIPEVDETDSSPPPDPDELRRRAIPAIPTIQPSLAGRAIPAMQPSAPEEPAPARAISVGSTDDLEERGLQDRTMGRPIPVATAPQAGSTTDLEARSLQDFEHPKSAPIQTGVASLWTKASNIHNPVLRVLGEIGAGGARALDAIGTVAAPNIARVIPGTTMNQRDTEARQVKQDTQQAAIGKTDADTAEAQARADAIRNPKPPVDKPESPQQVLAGITAEDIDKGVDPNQDPRVQQVSDTITSLQKEPAGVKVAPLTADQATQRNSIWNPILQKNHLPTNPFTEGMSDADAKEIAQQLNNATGKTQAGIHIDMGKQAADKKNANAFYRYTDATGTHVVKGDQVPEGVDTLPIKDPESYYNEAHMSNIVQQSLNRLNDDLSAHPEIFDDAAARAILATSLEQIDRASAGILVAGTGGSIPLPSGLGDTINTALQNKALDKPKAEALKQYVADYKAAKDKAIVMQMEMQGGKIGRGSAAAFKAITDQLPNGATADSKTALRQMHDIQETQNELSSKYPDDNSRGFNKIKPSTGTGNAEPNRPDNVPKDYVYKENGPKGTGWYRP